MVDMPVPRAPLDIDLSTVWIVMPAYNEGMVVANTVKEVMTRFSNVLVIDDCSRDDTGKLAVEAGAVVLRHAINLGQGAALQTGIDYALLRDASEVVTFDSDGQHSVADAVNMIAALRAWNVDIVLGSRFLGATVGMSRRKEMFLKLAVAYTRLSCGAALTDTHNGLRALSRKAAQTIRIKQNRMAHASEIIEHIGASGLRYREYPVTITYSAYSVAKGQRMSGAANILFDLFVRKLHR